MIARGRHLDQVADAVIEAKVWLFQSQFKGDTMAIRYAVDLTDTERAEL